MKTHDYKARRNLVHLLICLILTFGIAIPIFAAAPIKTTPAPVVAKAPTITAALNADPASYSGTCPAVIKFEGKISVAGITKTNAPFTVTYEFIRSDGGKDTKPKTLTFKQDGSQSVKTTWTLGDNKVPSYKGWMAIKIAGKPPVESNKAEFSIQCKTGSLNAGQQGVPKQAQEVKSEDMKFAQKPLRKIPSTYSAAEIEQAKELNREVKRVDLVCSVKAYYDEARTIPVQLMGEYMGVYHLSPEQGPERPFNSHVYFRVEVKNIGRLSTAQFVVNKVGFSSIPYLFPTASYTTSPPVTLEPGEAVEYGYSYGPFSLHPSSKVVNKAIIIHVLADSNWHISEDDETNNACQYGLKFVWP